MTSAATAASHVLRNAPPQTWAYSPPKYTFETFALQALIKDPSDDPRLADALLGLPAFIEAWRMEKRALLASLLPPPTEAECGSSDDSVPATPNRERLDLATSIFACLSSWVGVMSVTAGCALIGWEAAGVHLRCCSLRSCWEHRPHFAPEGAAAAAAPVRLVGLDLDTATGVQMDRLCGDGSIRARKSKAPDMRFLCTLCLLRCAVACAGALRCGGGSV
ncbi:hypothetical protein B0H13DRAFT_2318162 [Mycena leptocephala]|nr:hypothetical protein B0H13DRAFT_2318162 [Mycena leptocephala]